MQDRGIELASSDNMHRRLSVINQMVNFKFANDESLISIETETLMPTVLFHKASLRFVF